MKIIRTEEGRWASLCGSGKGELVIMMLERVAQLMRVRQKKERVGTSSARAGLLVITSNGINIAGAVDAAVISPTCRYLS